MRSRSWIRWWQLSCCFWFQESSLLLFFVSFIFYQYLALYLLTRIALHVRDVGGLRICIMEGSVLCFCTWNWGQWTTELCWPICSFSLFVFATCVLWWWWFLDPTVDLLSTNVDWTCYCCLYVVVSDVHHRIFIYVETHLPHVCPLNKFIDIFLQFFYVMRVPSSAAKFSIICKFRQFSDNISIEFIYIYKKL